MKANEAYNQLYEALSREPGTAKGEDSIVMVTPDGHTYQVTNIHYNESLGVYIVSSGDIPPTMEQLINEKNGFNPERRHP